MKYRAFLYLATTVLTTTAVNAEVYKCGNGAKAVYQQLPCKHDPHKPPMAIKDISKERQLAAQKETKAYLEKEEQRQKEKQAELDKERARQIEEAKIMETQRQTNAIRQQTEALRNAPISNTYSAPYWPIYGYPYGQHDFGQQGHDRWDGHKQDHPHDNRDNRTQPNMNEQWWMNPNRDMNDQWWMKPKHNKQDQWQMKNRR